MKAVMITGASGGIGLKLAHHFAKDGHHLVLVARSKQKLENLAKELEGKYAIKTVVILADLGESTAVEHVMDEIEKRKIQIEMLVNNAGFGLYGEFHTIDWAQEQEMMMVNMMALTELTKRVVPTMINQKSGKILNVASTAAFQPGPLMATYYATKAYVLSFSEALENELKGTGVSVSILCPGPTETGFQQRARMEDSKLLDGGVMSADQVADIAYKAFMDGKTLIIPGTQNKLLSFMIRFMPRKLVTTTVRKVQERK
ncbi:SDR family NAD(P)-dependent oxidoreductase [Pseudalkalibacillus berkeleyi]|uniref:SDR family oxidoreductase n=1 Tax=Pseudalkalibacillus berkeleyi TaxID=1069813 RepID=A0ABS9H589_9BACL|nr:SDR family oxidoreductase [Pseudalkalibacillus berkeleyi]MCF6138997.1 SDR family oxidoreductase [Pseudalkalibacillus berkeleyi]